MTCTSHQIIRVIESRVIKWVGNAARMGERRGTCRDVVRKSEEKTTWKTQIQMEANTEMCSRNIMEDLDWTGSGQGNVIGFFESGNELSVSKKMRKFIDQWRNYWLLRTNPTPCIWLFNWLVGQLICLFVNLIKISC